MKVIAETRDAFQISFLRSYYIGTEEHYFINNAPFNVIL